MAETAEMQNVTTQTPSDQQNKTGAQGQTPAGAGGGQVQSQGQPGTAGMARAGGGRGAVSRRDPWGTGFGNPFAVMRALSDEMDRLFESFGFGGRGAGRSYGPGAALDRWSGAAGQGFWTPQIDVQRRGDELVVCADLPGMKKDDLHVEVREDHLVLQGERRQESEGEEGGLFRSERSYGRFYRAVPLPEGIDSNQARASFRDGVLEISMPLPKGQEQRARRIEIS